jgi:hypothetical protein
LHAGTPADADITDPAALLAVDAQTREPVQAKPSSSPKPELNLPASSVAAVASVIRVPVDLPALRNALTRRSGSANYLHLRTGDVEQVAPFDRERQAALERDLDARRIDPPRDPFAAHRQFAERLENPDARAALVRVLTQPGAEARFIDQLAHHGLDVRAWREFRRAFGEARVSAWLHAQRIEAISRHARAASS